MCCLVCGIDTSLLIHHRLNRPPCLCEPELTRTEYLRLLQTARALNRERVYLLVKLFGTTGLTVQLLLQQTVVGLLHQQRNIVLDRQADDFLPAVHTDAGGDPGHPDHLHAPGPAEF